jgi:ribosome-associated translation inhibitor RaiA
MIQFGEKIILEGFNDANPGEITILRKIIGNAANNYGDFRRLTLNLNREGNKSRINAVLEMDDERLEASSNNDNLFFAVNEVLSKLRR